MQAWQLIQALENGQRLIKDFKYAYPEQYGEVETGEIVQKLWFENKRLKTKGRGSEFGHSNIWLEEIISYPERFQIENTPNEITVPATPELIAWLQSESLSYGFDANNGETPLFNVDLSRFKPEEPASESDFLLITEAELASMLGKPHYSNKFDSNNPDNLA